MTRLHRLFIAVDPPQEVLDRVAAIVDRLRASGVEADWVHPAQVHLTLHFLGDEVDDADLARIRDAMDEVAAATPAFPIALGGVDVFPGPQRPRVVWLGVREGEGSLVRLHDALWERLEPIGCPPEARGYRPHLTLGRFRRRSPPPAAFVSREQAAACTMRVAGIALHESRLSAAGAEHDLLHSSPLA